MTIDWLRDLIICIAGLTLVGVLVVFTVIGLSLYSRVKVIIDAVRTTSENVADISASIAEVVKPVSKAAVFINGLRRGIGFITGLWQKEGKAR